ncbi:MAG TPA: class I SAM-dependent methyltransferase [Mycobacteriales bacterium]|nr:class I SAM-dependent methyltransferase [Mycobacteriales bacterium]
MGDLDQLRDVFAGTWDWSTGGEEWSTWWGGTPSLWFGGLLPRIHAFVPAGTILEIAPGFGRWSQYLKDMCDQLVLVDLAPKCIEHCQQRFASSTNIEYHVNDGKSLPVADGSVDFVFSWDSLVHADAEIIDGYVAELHRVLSPNGVAFIHHSNVASIRRSHDLAMRAPKRLLRRLTARGVLLDVFAWRAADVSADGVAKMASRHGLACASQEIFNWEHGRFLTEAISVLTHPASRFARKTERITNHAFRQEARLYASLYAASSFPDASA